MNLRIILELINKEADVIIQERVEETKKGFLGLGQEKAKTILKDVNEKTKVSKALNNLKSELLDRKVTYIDYQPMKRSFILVIE